MKQYIVVDDRFKIGQYLLGIAKSLMANNKSVKVVSEAEVKGLAISPTYNKPYNKRTQMALENKEVYEVNDLDEFLDSI